MLDHSAIKLAYRNAVADVAGLPPEDRRAYENMEFSPPSPDPNNVLDSIWIREGYASGDEVQAASDTIEGPGIYTVDVLVPKGAGTKEQNELVKAIMEALHPATSLVTDNVEVSIDRTARLPGREENGIWYVVSVQSTWRCYDIG